MSSKSKKKSKKAKEDTQSSKIIDRIPWPNYLRNQIGIIIGALVIFSLLFIIIDLSANITSDRIDEVNPNNVLSSSDNTHRLLIILPLIVYVLVLIFFLKIVFFDHKKDFGITTLKSVKALLFLFLTVIFITIVYILFDIALINIYLLIGPILAILNINDLFDIPFLNIRENDVALSNRKLYSDVRGFIFSILFAFMVLVPLILTINILARMTKTSLNIQKLEPKHEFSPLQWMQFVGILVGEGVLLTLYFLISSLDPKIPVQLVFIPIMLGIGIWWLILFSILVFRSLRFSSWLFYSNIAVVVLLIVLFYVLPAIIWSTWDVYTLLMTEDTANTVFVLDSFMPSKYSPIEVDSIGIYKVSSIFILKLYLQSFLLNIGSIIRIIELDFVIIIGLSSIVIGFAEGYSIIAILRGLYTGTSVTRSGRVAAKSAPKLMVIITRLIFLLTWISLAWDKFVVIWDVLTVKLNIPFLPKITFPRIFEIIFNITLKLAVFGKIVFVISILLLPLYFVLTSSFKFLSVTLVAERAKNDNRTFFYLISSAFILIASNILADISSLPEFASDHANYLPLRGIATEELLPFVSKIFEVFEAGGFFFGLFYSIIAFFKLMWKNIKNKMSKRK